MRTSTELVFFFVSLLELFTIGLMLIHMFLLSSHRKYERSKQLTLEIKENETKLLEKLEFAQQQMKLQEQRYDKLKNHAFTQLER